MTRLLRQLVLILLVAVILAGCGAAESASESTATSTSPVSAAGAATATPTVPSPTPTPGLTPEQLDALRPNELGWVPILQYHHFGHKPDQFTRTLVQFKRDLQWLYDHDFYVVNLHDYLDDMMDVPAGKQPVVLTFDDSPVSQFRLKPRDDGRLEIDSDCAIAVLEQFYRDHPDFGRGGHFAVLPDRTFAWPEAKRQFKYATPKLEWLLDNGYEVGNHTMHHANLAEKPWEKVKEELARGEMALEEQYAGVDVRVVTLPYGAYPGEGDASIFKGFTYQGERFFYDAVLLVGANPSPSVLSKDFDPYAIPRIQAFDESLDHWFTYMEDNPGIIYTSDGSLETVTIPRSLHQGLIDTFDETSVGDRELVRY